MVNLRARRALPSPVSLAEIRANRKLARMALVQRGQRLSVQPVTPAQWREVLRMGGLEADGA
jgi:predicted RNA-binding protein with PUA-like domain